MSIPTLNPSERIMIQCLYCEKSIENDDVVELRFGKPLHAKCNAELNEELAIWELASGLVPESPYGDNYNDFTNSK